VVTSLGIGLVLSLFVMETSTLRLSLNRCSDKMAFPMNNALVSGRDLLFRGRHVRARNAH
jgi:hypothetical protein